MNVNTPSPMMFGSHFKVRLNDPNGNTTTAAPITVAIADTLIDEMAPRTSSVPQIGRINPAQPALGYAYEIPGILNAYANQGGVDVVCRDLYDPMVSELLQNEAQAPRIGTHANVHVSVQQTPDLAIADETALAEANQNTRQLYELG